MTLPSIIGYDRARRLSVAGIVAYLLTMVALFVAACAASGCGGAQSVGAGTACSSLMLLIGERRDYAPERAVADIETVSEVCRRLAAPVDAGTP